MEVMKDFIESLKTLNFYTGQIKDVITIPARPSAYAPVPALSEPLLKYLSGSGISFLYSHQAEALNLSLSGKNVIMTTPTASGKTLGFNLPVIETLLSSPGSTALYVYPAKALSNDQLNTLNTLFEKSGANLKAGIYDGDTPSDKKKILRENADIIITNPYELHQILPYHSKWKRFYKNLKYVVLDEAHRYRGIFGSNIALLIRRMKRIASLYGAPPCFIASTASIANGVEFMEKLTGEKFTEVSQNGAPSAERHLVLWDSSAQPDRSVHTQTKDLLLHSAKNGFQTLAFAGSRKMAELIRIWANRENRSVPILSYRAGYDPKVRRGIEADLKSGKIKGLVSTDALELGIDIGMLDVIILSGYPGSISSFWQMAGRAGRTGRESAVIYLPFEDALQKYLLKNPSILTSMRFENAVISLHNPDILLGHMLCALSEAPAKTDDIFIGLNTKEALEFLAEKKLAVRTARGIIYAGAVRPHDNVALDSQGASRIKIKVEGRILEEIALNRAYREAHTGAVYIHNGETYVIRELSLERGEATASKEAADYHTETMKNEDVKITETQRSVRHGSCTLNFGNVSVTEIYKGYKRKKGAQITGYDELHMPPLNFNTESVWITLNTGAEDAVLREKLDFNGALHAAEHALIALAPVFAMAETNDIGGMSYPDYEGEGPVIFIYDGFEGGIGISEKLFEMFDGLKDKTIELVETCGCEAGCPMCVYSPKCGNNNNPIDKKGSLVLLKSL